MEEPKEEVININKNCKKKKSHMFEIYISKVLKQISTTNGITNNAKQQLNSAICHILKYISSVDVQQSVNLALVGYVGYEVSHVIQSPIIGDWIGLGV